MVQMDVKTFEKLIKTENSAGDTVQTYEYSVYGLAAAEDPNHPNPYMFTGRRFDIEVIIPNSVVEV